MKARYTWLLVLLLGLLIAAYQYSGTLEFEKQIQEFEAKKFFTSEYESVSRIKITKRDEDPIAARFDGDGKWSIIQPHDFIPANSALWTNLAQFGVNFINERSIKSNPTNLESFGLDDPILEVELTIDNEDHLFQFGHPDPTKNNRYTRKDDGEIFLMPANFAQVFFRNLEEVRDLRIMPLMAEGINKLVYKRGEVDDPVEDDPTSQAIDETYEANTNGVWQITAPEKMVAFQKNLIELADKLQFGTAKNHIDDPESMSDYGLDNPWATLTAFNQENAQSQTLLFGWNDTTTENAGFYSAVEGSPIVFTIPYDLFVKLPEGPGDYREKRLMTKKADDLSSITYKDNRNTMTLVQDDKKGWILDSPTQVKMDNIAVSAYLAVLLRIQGETFPKTVPPDALAPPRIELTMAYEDGTEEIIQIGGLVPDTEPLQFYARQDFGQYTTIPLPAFTVLQAEPFRFQDKHLFPTSKNVVTAMEFDLENVQYRFEKDEKLWKLTRPADIQMSSLADPVDLLDILLEMEAAGIVAPVPQQDIMGFTKPIATLTATTTVGNVETTRKIEIGNLMAPNSRLRFTKTDKENEFFYVNQTIIDSIRIILDDFRSK